MSTLLYGALERKRLDASAGQSVEDEAPGLRTYADSLAALVPAEALALFAVLYDLVAERSPSPDEATADAVGETGNTVAREVIGITDTTDARLLMISLLILTPVLYLAGRVRKASSGFERLDLLRMLIPPLAFAAWVLLAAPLLAQVASGGVPVLEDLFGTENRPKIVASAAAVFLGLLAALLGYKADQKPNDDDRNDEERNTVLTRQGTRITDPAAVGATGVD